MKLADEMGKAWLLGMLRDGVAKGKAEEVVKLESWERITKAPLSSLV